MKKAFALVLAMALCLATLTACGGNGGTTSNGAASTTVSSSQS